VTQQPPALSCNRERLVRSLEDALPERDEEQLVEHLSSCVSCQQELEQLAAEKADWTRVGTTLREESNGVENDIPPTELRGEARPSEHPHEDTLSDFSVDFLAPALTEDSLGRLDGIDILEVIGRGGMGVVLKGFEQELNRPVVVKMLAPHLASSGAARKRFAREAQATAVIVHPNVMPILTVNSTARLPYLVMPYMACESLQQRIDREGPLETLDVLRISHQVACGLAAAHAQGLVHRDVKPANILLERGVDRVLLTDFGLARAADDASLTRTGVIAGTPQFMSPEQARGEAVDARSDLFCLGSVMYVLCAGRPPFRAETSYGVLRRITDETARPICELNAAIPDWLERIVTQLHSKDPANRLQSADETAELLEKCIAHVQQPTVVPLPVAVRSTENSKSDRRISRPQLAAATGVMTLGLAIALLANPGGDHSAGSSSESGTASESSRDEAASGPASAPSSMPASGGSLSAAEAWQDSVDSEILNLRSATDELEVRSRELWDVRPIGTAVTFKTSPSSYTSSSSRETSE
jgi:serine/threonine protein kinase